MTLQVVDANPTGKPKKHEQLPDGDPQKAVYKEREDWLVTRLVELGKDPKVKKVRVLRGSLDDVIGVQTEE